MVDITIKIDKLMVYIPNISVEIDLDKIILNIKLNNLVKTEKKLKMATDFNNLFMEKSSYYLYILYRRNFLEQNFKQHSTIWNVKTYIKNNIGESGIWK